MNKKFDKKKIAIICTSVILLCSIVGLFYFRIYKKDKIILNNNKGHIVKRVEKFNSFVPGVYILNISGDNYNSIAEMFHSVGYDVMEGNFENYIASEKNDSIFIAPDGELNKLSSSQIDDLLEQVNKGKCIITTGKSKISEKLGINIDDKKMSINKYIWKSTNEEIEIRFSNLLKVNEFTANSKYSVLAYTKDKTPRPIAVCGKFGSGSVLYSSIPLAPINGSGYEYYPLIMETLTNFIDIKPTFARYDGAVYLDIGFHLNETPSQVAEKIKKWGFDKVNVGMWFSIPENKDYVKNLIYECHKRGISVYAWFEYPMVSNSFWDKHPEWREITASGKEAHLDWRYLMALEDPKCLDAVKKHTENMMNIFDFDGIDLAEIYFEAPGQGIRDSDTFTPMHPSFRNSFKKKYGLDPKEIFNPISKHYWRMDEKALRNLLDYRVEVVRNLYDEFLSLSNDIKKKKPYIQTDVTVIDSLFDTNMKDHIGVDAAKLTQLQKKYNFVLQIEDPFTMWSLGPERYRLIGEKYRKIMNPNNKLAIDINIIGRYGNVYPTKKQRGLELYQLVNQAGTYTDKVIMYALCTMEPEDMKLMPYAQAYGIKVEQIDKNSAMVISDKKFKWTIDTRNKEFYIDNKKWPIYDENGVIIPGGKHKVSFVKKDYKSENIQVESLNAEIKDASYDGEEIKLIYESSGRCFITLNKKPKSIRLDGKGIEYRLINYNNKSTIMLPQGRHNLELR